MPVTVPPLSAAALAKIKPHPSKTIELSDGAVAGLRVRIAPSGAKCWSLNMRANGVLRRFEVGRELSLSEARKRASNLRLEIRNGADPTAAKRADRLKAMSAVAGIGTFESVIDAYFTIGTGSGLRTRHEQQARVKAIFVYHLSRPAIDLKSSELQLSIDAHPSRVSAARAVGYIGPVLKWARKRDLMQVGFPLEKPIQDAPRQRFLTEEELKTLLPTLDDDAYGYCCKLILLTGVRLSEARDATWDQFDLQPAIWTIPGELRKDTRSQARRRGKPKEAHVIPLSTQAIELLELVRQAEVKRRTAAKNRTPIAGTDPVFIHEGGGRLVNWPRWLKANKARTKMADWSAHALRRTAATLAGDLNAPPHLVSVILGHTNIGGQLVAGYNKSRYSAEHARILQKLADKINQISNSSSQFEIDF